MRYVCDSPFLCASSLSRSVAGLHEEKASLEEFRADISKIQAAIQAVGRSESVLGPLRQLEVEELHGCSVGPPSGNVCQPRLIGNRQSSVLHIASVWDANVPPVCWSTRCSWRFGRSPARFETSKLVTKTYARCPRCWRSSGTAGTGDFEEIEDDLVIEAARLDIQPSVAI